MLAEIIAVITVVLSIVSTGVAAFSISYSKTLKNIDINQQNYEDVKEWYEKTLEILKDLYIEHTEHYETSKQSELNKCLVQLSKQIDMSKIYFENKLDGNYQINKPEVFRGRRPLIADFLILYYDIFQQNKQCENFAVLRSLQRAFSSELTKFLNANKNSSKFVPYEVYDYNNIVNINNLDNQALREVLISEDIISQIEAINMQPQQAIKYKIKSSKNQKVLNIYNKSRNNKIINETEIEKE